ncbi:MAG: YdcF family protein [Microcoleaceae cyanobacterium]
MFVQLTRLLLLLLIGTIIFRLWKLLVGGKDSNLVSRLWFILGLFLLMVAFTAPDSPIGQVVLEILAVFIKPLGLSILLLIIACTQITKDGIRNPAPNLILTSLLILILSSTPFVAQWLAFQLEQTALTAIQPDLCCGEKAGAIVLLGRGTTEPKLPYRSQIQLTRSGDRIPYTAQLYRDRFAPNVIVSAGPRKELFQPTNEAEDVKRLLVYMGVSSGDIVVEPHGSSVSESVRQVKKIMKEQNLGRTVVLVTSALEIRRASLAFADAGFKVIPAPTNFNTFVRQDKQKHRVSGADFAPSAEALLLTTRVFEEYLITFYYFVRGWLAPSI